MTRVYFTGEYACKHIVEIFRILKDLECDVSIFEYDPSILEIEDSSSISKNLIMSYDGYLVHLIGLKTLAELKGLNTFTTVYCRFDDTDKALQFKLSLP